MRLFTILLILLCFFCAAVAGCATTSSTSRQDQAAIAQGHSAAATQAAAIADRHTVDAALATASPAAHPVTAANQTVSRLRAPLIPIAVASLIAVGVFVGLTFTAFSWISKIGIPVSAGVFTVCLFGSVALPFVPWILIAAAVGLAGLLVYETIRAKSLAGGLTATEKDLGIYDLAPAGSSSPAVTLGSTLGPTLGTISNELLGALHLGTAATPAPVTPAPAPTPAHAA